MSKEWPTAPIADVCASIVDCVNQTAPVVDHPTPYRMIRTTNVRDGWVDVDNVRFVTKATFDRWTRRQVPQRQDIILTREAPLGGVGMLRSDRNVFLGQRTVAYRVDPARAVPEYVLYAMMAPFTQNQIMAFGSGSTVEHMRVPDCGKFEVPVPPLPIQKRIAAILSAYDDLIEVNTRRIAILEEMARRIYEEWFVRGADPEWDTATVADLGEVVTGKTPSKKQSSYWGRGVPFLKLPDMHDAVMVFETSEHLSDAGAVSQRAKLIPTRSVCVSCIGTAGVVVVNAVACHTNQQINSIIPNVESTFPFVYFTMRQLKPLILAYGATGATMANLSRGKLANLPVVVPPQTRVDEFCDAVGPMFDLIELLSRSNTNLRAQRDLLLPRLVSGKLDVSGLDTAEKELAHA